MSEPPPSPLPELLAYLDAIGYGDLYLPRREEGDEARAPSLRATAALPKAGPPAEERRRRLDEVCAGALACTRCRLAEGRRHVVFADGDPDADLMFVGEGPGADEDRLGKPFVGRAGELLDKIIAAIGLKREEVYIANVVKCRPPQNRDPEADEAAACREYLEAQIELVRPRILVALGRVAAQSLLGTDESLGRLRGRFIPFRGAELRATYHPAALLRYPHYKRPTWEDMQAVRDRLLELRGGAGPRSDP